MASFAAIAGSSSSSTFAAGSPSGGADAISASASPVAAASAAAAAVAAAAPHMLLNFASLPPQQQALLRANPQLGAVWAASMAQMQAQHAGAQYISLSPSASRSANGDGGDENVGKRKSAEFDGNDDDDLNKDDEDDSVDEDGDSAEDENAAPEVADVLAPAGTSSMTVDSPSTAKARGKRVKAAAAGPTVGVVFNSGINEEGRNTTTVGRASRSAKTPTPSKVFV
jgi:hypothetical protein